MPRPATTDEQVIAQWGVVPVGDIVIAVTAGDETIARMDIYWHTVKVGCRKPIPVAWFDHLAVDPNYQGFGYGTAMFATAEIVAAREVEWAVGPFESSEFPWFPRLGWFKPDGVEDNLYVGPLAGQPRAAWPSGKVVAPPPAAKD